MSGKAKIAFLYTEIAGYTVACLKELAISADVLLYRWPVNSEAPFEFQFPENVEVIDRKGKTVDEIYNHLVTFGPEKLICSGWMDKDYVKIVKKFKRSIPTVVCIDNHWVGSLKQKIASAISPVYLKRTFTHAWVPGDPQFKFAVKLGFPTARIERGFYCADTDLFTEAYTRTKEEKRKIFPKRILYLARYVEHKGIFEMWNAFIEWQKNNPSDWELWCVGTGDEWENRVEHEKIRHFGFMQPSEMSDIIRDTGVYILPSKFEPWGVSVQEFAVAGYPLLISEEVGAASAFCRTENGFVFTAGSEEEIKRVFEQLERLSGQELIQMAGKSHQIGLENTPCIWTEKILNIKA